MGYDGVMEFYRDRILSCPHYGFKAGHELLDLIQKCAYHDMYVAILTSDEYISIINLCYKAHIKMMEENYNAGWQDNQQNP